MVTHKYYKCILTCYKREEEKTDIYIKIIEGVVIGCPAERLGTVLTWVQIPVGQGIKLTALYKHLITKTTLTYISANKTLIIVA